MSKIRVVVVEDQDDIAENVERMLLGAETMEFKARYSCAEDALAGLGSVEADVYLVDLGLPGMSGVDFIEQASAKSSAQYIVHTISDNGKDLIEAMSVGAVGYVSKGCLKDELISAIETVATGGTLISSRMARQLCHFFKEIGRGKDILTKTEMEILEKLKNGHSYEKISDIQHVSVSTVQSHIKNIYKKLNVKNRRDAILAGTALGLIKE